MGDVSGNCPDPSGTIASVLFYEYTARCQFNKNWSCSASFHFCWNCFKCSVLFLPKQEAREKKIEICLAGKGKRMENKRDFSG